MNWLNKIQGNVRLLYWDSQCFSSAVGWTGCGVIDIYSIIIEIMKKYQGIKIILVIIWNGHITHITFLYGASDRHREGTHCWCKLDLSLQVLIDLQGSDNGTMSCFITSLATGHWIQNKSLTFDEIAEIWLQNKRAGRQREWEWVGHSMHKSVNSLYDNLWRPFFTRIHVCKNTL